MTNGDAARASSPPSSTPRPTPERPPDPPAVRPSALAVDDEPANCDFLVRLLRQAPFEVCGACTGQQALSLAENMSDLALIVIDHRLPDMSGVELMVRLREKFSSAVIVMATMHDERSLMETAFERGCDVFLVKPHGFMELFKRLKTAPVSKLRDERLIIDQYGPRPYRG